MSSSYFVVRAGSTAVTNEAIFSGISHTALGILVRALSSRPGATLGYRDFMTEGVGERLVRRALKELEAAGLRHRVLTRTGCGSLRTVVVYTDVPMDAADVITQIDGLTLIKVQSERDPDLGRYSPRSHRADAVSARSDQEECKTAEKVNKRQTRRSRRADTASARSDQAKDPVSPVRTVPTLPKHGAPEHGASRQVPYGNSIPSGELDPTLPPSIPHSSELANGEAAASPREGAPGGAWDGDWPQEPNSQTGVGEWSSSGAAASPRVGVPAGAVALKVVPEPAPASVRDARMRPQGDSGAMNHIDGIQAPELAERSREVPSGPDSGRSGVAVAPEDRELLEKVLPEPMRAIPPRDVPRVAGAVRERLAAGWSAEQIRRGLAARDLPDRVRHLTALVMARFRDDVPVDALPLDGGGGGDASPGCRQPWRVVLDDGRTVGVRDLDMGAVAMAYAQARADGDPRASGNRFAFAEAVGVEHFLLEPVRGSRSAGGGGRG